MNVVSHVPYSMSRYNTAVVVVVVVVVVVAISIIIIIETHLQLPLRH